MLQSTISLADRRINMKISDIFKKKDFTISLEVFPPKQNDHLEKIYEPMKEMALLRPDFISVTYGASGSNNKNTLHIANLIQNDFNLTSIAHLTCLNSTKQELDTVLNNLQQAGIQNILALRGDRPEGFDPSFKSEFKHASELIRYIKQNYDFSVGAACYPEGHIENPVRNDDIRFLKKKVDEGADFLITQMFFDNTYIYHLIDKLDLLQVNPPIIAGIMPITNKNQIEKIAALSGAKFPHKLERILNKYQDDNDILKEAGIIYATEQILDLISSEKVQGIHIYSMNKPEIARKIINNIRPLVE